MKCSYCGKDIEQNVSVKVNTDYFCNNLCKYSFQKDISSKNEFNNKKIDNSIPDDLKFHIDLPNFKLNKLIVQGSFYGYPKLFLNNKKLKPVKKNIFTRKQIFNIEDDDVQVNKIILENRFLDAIPSLKINGTKVEIEKSLKWYEYLWVAIPSILFFSGGAIGAFIGLIATYTNSVLFRKFNNKFVRYLLTATNSFVAFILFFKVVLFLLPLTQELSFRYLQQKTSIENNKTDYNEEKFNLITSHPWMFKGFYDSNGNDLTPPNSIIKGSKRYFYKNGKISQVFYNGSVVEGKWSFNNNFDSLKVTLGNESVSEKILKLTSEEFNLEYQNAQMVHIPYKFSISDLF